MNLYEKEIWRPVKGYEYVYEVSNWGHVRSLDRINNNRSYKGVVLKPKIKKSGYLFCCLSVSNVKKYKHIHRLVAEEYVPNTLNLPCVNHIIPIKSWNYFWNLEWCTHSQNIQHALDVGVIKNQKGEGNIMAKLTNQDVVDIISLSKDGLKPKDLSAKYGVDAKHIWRIVNRKRWGHLCLA